MLRLAIVWLVAIELNAIGVRRLLPTCGATQVQNHWQAGNGLPLELGPDFTNVAVVLGQVRLGRRDADAHDRDQNAGRYYQPGVSPGESTTHAAPCEIATRKGWLDGTCCTHSACSTSITLVLAAQRPGRSDATMATATPSSGIAISSKRLNTSYTDGGVSFPVEVLTTSFSRR